MWPAHPGIVRRSVRDRLGRGDEPQLGSVGPPDDHEAGVEVLLRQVVGVLRPVAGVLQELHSLVVRLTFDLAAEILEQDRHTLERPVGQWAGSFLAGPVEEWMDHRVQLGVELLDAVDRRIDELER